MPLAELLQHLPLQLAEALLPIALKNLGDAAASGLADHRIGIKKAVAESFGQQRSHRALAAAHHSHQIQVRALEPFTKGLGWIRRMHALYKL